MGKGIIPKGLKRKRSDAWRQDEIDVIIKEWDRLSCTEIAEILAPRTRNAVKTKALELKVKKSKETMRELCRRTNRGQFIKGRRPAEEIPLLTVSVRTTASARYKYIKLGIKKWIPLQHYNWQQAGNTVPEGYVLCFKDNDPLNCEVSNLELLKRGPHSRPERRGPTAEEIADRKISKERDRAFRTAARIELREKNIAAREERQRLAREANKSDFISKKEERAKLRQLRIDMDAAAKQLKQLKRQEAAAARLLPKPEKVKIIKVKTERVIIVKPEKIAIVKPVKIKPEKVIAAKRPAKRAEDEKELADKLAARELKRTAEAKLKAIRINKAEKTAWDNRKVYKTKTLDLTDKIPLWLDERTVIYISPDKDPEVVRLKYLTRDASRLHEAL